MSVTRRLRLAQARQVALRAAITVVVVVAARLIVGVLVGRSHGDLGSWVVAVADYLMAAAVWAGVAAAVVGATLGLYSAAMDRPGSAWLRVVGRPTVLATLAVVVMVVLPLVLSPAASGHGALATTAGRVQFVGAVVDLLILLAGGVWYCAAAVGKRR